MYIVYIKHILKYSRLLGGGMQGASYPVAAGQSAAAFQAADPKYLGQLAMTNGDPKSYLGGLADPTTTTTSTSSTAHMETKYSNHLSAESKYHAGENKYSSHNATESKYHATTTASESKYHEAEEKQQQQQQQQQQHQQYLGQLAASGTMMCR